MKKKKIIEKEILKSEVKSSVKINLWPFIIAVLLVVIYILHILVFFDFEILLSTPDKAEFLKLLKLRTFELACLIIFAFLLLFMIIRNVKIRWLRILSTVFIWLFLFLYCSEFYFSVKPLSQGNDEAYVAKVWFKKYWQSNRYGFRDKDYQAISLKYRRNLLLYMGDSYAAGHGIKNPEDRTSDLLAKSLEDKYSVINLGRNGLGTKSEYELLKGFPGFPKIIILSHVANDIEDVLPKDETYSKIYQNSSSFLSSYIYEHSRNSISLDLIYHFVKMIEYSKQMKAIPASKKAINKQIYDWYKVDTIFNKHLTDIQNFADYACDTLGAKFIFVTYPENYDIDSCDLYINKKLNEHLRPDKNQYFLNLSYLFKQLSPSERRVSMLDNHPSRLVHKMAADSLIKILLTEKLILQNKQEH